MTLTETRQIIKEYKWVILIPLVIVLFFVVIYLKLAQKTAPSTIVLNLSPDLPILTTKTISNVSLGSLQIPKTTNSYSQSNVDQDQFNSISSAFGFSSIPATIKSKNGDILFWKKDNQTLSISTSTFKLSYQQYFKTSAVKSDAPNESASRQKVTDYLKKLNLTSQNIDLESPKITYYKDLIEGTSPVTDNSYQFIIFEYQPSIEGIPLITINPLTPPVYATAGPGNEIFQLKVDLSVLETPKLDKTLKTKSAKKIEKEIKSGQAAIISSTGERMMETDARINTFNSTKTRLAYLKNNDIFTPVVELIGNAQTAKGQEAIIIVTPLADGFVFLSKNK